MKRSSVLQSPPTSLELFAGAGGLALGIRYAGFRHIGILELDRHACATLNLNRATLGLLDEQIISPLNVIGFDYGPYRNKVTLLAGGVPCQPFSRGGKHYGAEDHRNHFPEMFRAVRELRPDIVIIENVRGLLRHSFRPYLSYICEQLARPDRIPDPDEPWQHHMARLRGPTSSDELLYRVAYQAVNCADFGIPQYRERVFVVAFRRDLSVHWKELETTHSRSALLWAQWVDGSYWMEHALQTPPLPNALRPQVSILRNQGKPVSLRWSTLRDALVGLPAAEISENHPSISGHAINPGARSYRGHTGSRLDWPSKTLKAGDHGVPGGENTVVLDDGSFRYLTVREAARLQTFPDSYHFAGSWIQAMRQLGNAVPVQMAALVANSAKAQLGIVSPVSDATHG